MSSKNREARVYYGPGAFRMLANGDHVLCAVTGAVIPLDELRYYRKAFMAPVPGPSEAEAKAIASEIQETSLLNKD